MSNQFQTALARLQMPEHMAGSTVSVGGFSVEPDADGIVEVPQHMAPALLAHGLTPAPAKAAAAPAAQKAPRTQQQAA